MKHGVTMAVMLLWAALAAAQGTVYESKDKAGVPTFSNQPSPGAKPVQVQPPTVVTLPSAAPPAGAAAAPPAYKTLQITAPAPQGTIHSNTGAFDVQLNIAPALRKGDVIRVKLDGTLLERSFTAPRLTLTEADWAAAANPDNVEHGLQAAIVDRNGQVLLESAPVRFYVHRAVRR
jgi:hypothetical protein